MGYRGIITSLSFILSACAHAQVPNPSGSPLPSNEWSRVSTPSTGPATPIGFYSAGCIAGAATLPLDGNGYQVMRIFRNRYYGHPDTIQFVQTLGNTIAALGSGVLIGDMGQPRGGPLPYGHASHQVGLDVDVWFWTHPEQTVRSLTADERNNLPMISMLNSNGLVDPALFKTDQILKLKAATADPKVERIFVNPAIKTYLCSTLPMKELSWLHKLRPWPGHDEHFHVRLVCPADDKNCQPQEPPAPGDGCDELIPPRHQQIGEGPVDSVDPVVQKLLAPALPAQCAKILKE